MKVIKQHFATVTGYGHMPMSGLAEMHVQTDDAGAETIYGDWRMINAIAEAFPKGSRCQIFLTDEDGYGPWANWKVTDEDTDLSEPAGESGAEYA